MKPMDEKFTRIPNHFIQCNIHKVYGLSRAFYVVYLLIDKYRTRQNYSWITLREILDFYKYKIGKNRPKAVDEILDVLNYMVQEQMIEIQQDLERIGYKEGIKIRIIPENFAPTANYAIITDSQFDAISGIDASPKERESVLVTFLYVSSYIQHRKKMDNGDDYVWASENPEVFYGSVDKMAKTLGMSKSTISKSLKCLTSTIEDHKALLVKKSTRASRFYSKNNPNRMANIYALNKPGYHKELQWAFDKMAQKYCADPQKENT